MTRIRYCGWIGSRVAVLQRRHLRPPLHHSLLRLLQERAVVLARRAAEAAPAASRPRRRPAAPRSGSGSRPSSGSMSICTTAHLPGGGKVLGVREVGADHQQRVGLFHRLFRRQRAQQTDAPVVSGWSSGTDALPGSVLTIGLASSSATSQHLVARRRSAPAPAKHHDLRTRVQHRGGAFEVSDGGHARRRRCTPAPLPARAPGRPSPRIRHRRPRSGRRSGR